MQLKNRISDGATNKFYRSALLVCAFLFLFSVSFAQKKTMTKPANKNLPKVTRVDEVSIKKILVPDGKPLLVNFWATWCVPCREEFPDLVEIDNTFKGKIDFITISLDDLAEINRDVPKFLSEMKAEMPAYLLNTNEESQVISSISKDWQGGLPFTILYDENGEVVHTKQGKIKPEIVKEKIYELLNAKSPEDVDEDSQLKIKISKELKNAENSLQKGKSEILQEKNNETSLKKPVEVINLVSYSEEQYNYKKGLEDAKTDIANGNFIIKTSGFGLYPKGVPEYEKENYPVKYQSYGCVVSSNLTEYIDGYNEVSRAEIKRRFGDGYGVLPAFRANKSKTDENIGDRKFPFNHFKSQDNN